MMKKAKRTISLLCAVLMTLGLMGCGEKKDKASEIPLKEVHEKIQEAYGENYLPGMDYDSQILETVFGIQPEWIDEFIAQGPTMSAHVDTFIAIRATEGHAENVKKALETYRQTNIDSNMNYPMNLPKLEQSQVYQTGDYVFYVMLGAYYDGEDAGEEQTFYKEQTQIALDIIQEYE